MSLNRPTGCHIPPPRMPRLHGSGCLGQREGSGQKRLRESWLPLLSVPVSVTRLRGVSRLLSISYHESAVTALQTSCSITNACTHGYIMHACTSLSNILHTNLNFWLETVAAIPTCVYLDSKSRSTAAKKVHLGLPRYEQVQCRSLLMIYLRRALSYRCFC